MKTETLCDGQRRVSLTLEELVKLPLMRPEIAGTKVSAVLAGTVWRAADFPETYFGFYSMDDAGFGLVQFTFTPEA